MGNKNIIIASSGTGGHVYPGIAMAEEFKNKGYNPIFFISNNPISLKILKNSQFKHIEFNISGMPRKISFAFLIFLVQMKFSFLKALKQIIELNPVAVVGTGGYIVIPVLFAAKVLKKKIFIHEQNAIPGKANRLLNKVVDKTFISFPSSNKILKNVTISGCPIRKSLLLVSKEKALLELKLKNEIFTILVFGGSLGTITFGEIVCKILLDLYIKDKFQVLHIAGPKNYIKIKKKVKDNSEYRVFDYMHNIADAYVASDVVICRSGASTIFELKTLDKSAILIPYPYATDNHQYWNAKEIEKSEKVVIIEEKNLTKENLTKAIYAVKKKAKNNAVGAKNIIKLPQELIIEEIIKCIKS
ncbi:MAG: UDP-N-acetylglucosamine--N-acetylmuramyl-(pentapeptide) pyrophosphoryl-undecaprenol N-acetylglucosamine transferase [Endomicrobium sp.]|jgi:UDP-N-acetylglucosamine--N-acetylmuramyl-(pentapeptide) pyrophosphoryl-undecaprenol N-acetylglucosamine transferase|nr:UDP-N-acetylglucosamine--N-acetylmuramyl-(pentapeptide) pyrophosphoryl-undecaprenol N-acetylglucosamine transferase [Endomicrobium sp.]